MKKEDPYLTYIQDLLATFASIKIRAMFGGFGLYYQGMMFGLVAYNELYFKAEPESCDYFKSFKSQPFVYQGKTKPVSLSYWLVVPEVMEDPNELGIWFAKAIKAAKAAAKVKQVKKITKAKTHKGIKAQNERGDP